MAKVKAWKKSERSRYTWLQREQKHWRETLIRIARLAMNKIEQNTERQSDSRLEKFEM